MPAWGRTLVVLAALAGCATPQEPDTSVCAAVREMARTQERGASSTVAYFSADEPDAIFSVACRHDGDARGAAFCNAIVGHTSMEFLNAFAFDVADCIERHGRVLSLQLGDRGSGLALHPRNLERMSGRLSGINVTLEAIDRGFQVRFER